MPKAVNNRTCSEESTLSNDRKHVYCMCINSACKNHDLLGAESVQRLGYGLDGAGDRILLGPRDFSRLQNVYIGSGAHRASYLMGTMVLSWV
jgi:hypothetical protein